MRVLDEIALGKDKVCLVALGRESHPIYCSELWSKTRRRKQPYDRLALIELHYPKDETTMLEGTEKAKAIVRENLARWHDLVALDYVTVS